jgi:stage V sporulation protein AA
MLSLRAGKIRCAACRVLLPATLLDRATLEGGLPVVQVVYLKPRDSIIVAPGDDVTLGTVAEVFAGDTEVERGLRGQVLLPPLSSGSGIVVVSSLDLVRAVRSSHADIDVRLVGPPQTVVKTRVRPSRLLYRMWTAAVAAVLFFGAFTAIMSFHADVDMGKAQQGIYELVTGEANERPLVIQIPYSFGVGLGVLLFFNTLSRRRPSSDPSPLEVQLHAYDQDAEAYLVSQGAPVGGHAGKQK